MGKTKSKNKRKQPPPKKVEESESEEEEQDFGDDESIDDDEAFNSDDERKYGDFFDKDDDSDGDDESVTSQDSDEDSDDDDEEEGDGGQYMLDLLNQLDAPKDDKDTAKKEQKAKAAASHQVPESEFASSVVQKGSLTLDSLMAGLEDTKGFGVLQKSLSKIAQGQATAAPVAKAVSKRAERKVHYEDQAKQVSLWLQAVQQNRQAETLDFRPRGRMDVTRESLIDKFVPTTDFEKAIHAALAQAGDQEEDAILQAEEAEFMKQDDLGDHDLTMEEFQKRRGELAKMRALMFYHEQKRHRINKIKSKKYRRIRKKQRERAQEAELDADAQENPDLLKELEEKDEYDRMKERMTLAHKNTSKWAKRILKRGKNVDADTRKALSAQLARGDDLLHKMKHAKNNDGQEDDSDADDSEDLVESARKVLLETTQEEGEEDTERKGLFKLKFMQQGLERQREIAKEEARQLLRELGANEKLDDYDDAVMDDEMDDADDETANKKKKKRKLASQESMKSVINDGELVASSLKFGKSNAIATSGGIDIDLGIDTSTDVEKEDDNATDGNKKSKKKRKKKQQQQNSPTEAKPQQVKTDNNALENEGKKQRKNKKTPNSQGSNGTEKDDVEGKPEEKKESKKKKKKRKKKGQFVEDVEEVTEETNPWICAAGSDDKFTTTIGQSVKARTRAQSALKTGVVNMEQVVNALDSSVNRPKEQQHGDDNNQAKNKSITHLSQEELVRRAFARSDAKEVEDEFAQEKAEVEDEDNDTKTASQKKKEKDMAVVSGWGSWAGEGAPPSKPPSKLPKHLQPPPKKKQQKAGRQDIKRPNVIIREKRVKKTADKFMLKAIPYPFTSREEYERAMSGSMGKEWNVTGSVKDMTRPEIQTRPGKIIQPLSMKVKQQQRGPAKF
ncbi:associated protein 14 homolog A [Seminavis robusta]|uniref:Associated protein 14 homolog A n=1 Tax=Seminavis robusta TaxID=568900 RepID=A0A9N8H4N4_9STRA|nr:associated protein 14 homolog A [Seminavis robusta]|eukprot:Sro54_g031940.1 associated protein 14 homolog A (902) ;mRNA; f:82224-84929